MWSLKMLGSVQNRCNYALIFGRTRATFVQL